MSSLLYIKKNNKGNTLTIVLVGIFVLGILGTLILGMTLTNYNIKVTEKKSESTFYYAEKAIDEVYAGIGKEVMDCAKMSYEKVMENYVYDVADPSNPAIKNTTTLSETEAETMFNMLYVKGDTSTGGSIKGMEGLYPESSDASAIQLILNRLQNNHVKPVTNISINLIAQDGPSDKTEIVYDKVSGALKEVLIKNVCVKVITNSSGYYSSILTDFKIKVPNVDFDITNQDVPVGNNVDRLASYSIIAQGTTVGDDNKTNEYYPTILVSTTSKVTGNIYAGTGDATASNWVYTGDPNHDENERRQNISAWHEKSAIAVNPNATLKVEAKNVVCDGPITVAGGNIDFRGVGGFGTNPNAELDFNAVNYSSNSNVLNLYATDLITTKALAKMNIIGNCIISDDTEINGDQNEVAIKGNYYGYGFQAVNDEEIVGKNNSDILEASSGVTDTGFVSPNIAVKEHEKRSAIIINGTRADVNLTGLNTLILAGRAYIDLDSGTQYGNASYMTGESVSFKGNQQIYLADSKTGLEGANSNVTNPMAYNDLKTLANLADNMELTPKYSDLGLDSDKVVAKKIGSKVFFYNKETRPIQQSQSFMMTYYDNNSSVKRDEANRLVKETLQVKNLSFKSGLSYYTVGAFMSVNNGELQVSHSYNQNAKSADFNTNRFYNLIKEMRIRKSYMTPSLSALDYNMENSSIYVGMGLDNKTGTVYDYHVGDLTGLQEESNELLRNNEIVTYNGQTKAVKEFIKDITGKTDTDADTYHVGFYVDENMGGASTNPVLDEGIWISKSSISLNHSFKGLIITDSSVSITNNANIESSEELIKFMCTCDDPHGVFANLRKALKLNSSSETISALGISAGAIDYKALVEKSNWRKNVN